MRVSPAFQVAVRRFAVWQFAVALCIAASLGALGAWWWLLQERPPGLAALAAVALLAIVVAAGALRQPAQRLRWDTQRWWLGPADGAASERAADSLEVVLDFSSWMLLRVRLADAGRLTRTIWLPLQRRGLEREWHALRCAVHTSSPAAGRSDVDGRKVTSW